MNFGTLGGLISMFTLIALSIIEGGGSLTQFFDLPAIFIVVLGSTSCIIMGYPLSQVLKIPTHMKIIFTKHNTDYVDLIYTLITLAEGARKEGLLSLEDKVADIDEPFLKKGLQMAIDGVDEEIVKKTMHIDITQMTARHTQVYLMYETWAILSPSFGMVATLTGLVMMLGNLVDISSVGPGMSAALCGTFFGALMGYAVMTPIAKKLEVTHEAEVLRQEMVVEGVLSIIHGESARFLEEKLLSFLPTALKKQVAAKTHSDEA